MKINHYQAITCALALALAGPVGAEGSITVSRDVTVNVSAEKAWALVSGFCDIAAWHPVVHYCDMDRDQPTLGAMRTLTLGNGAQLFERLTDYDPERMTYSYTIPNAMGVLPVENYTSTLKVEIAGNNKAKITWLGNFDPSDPADPGASEEAMAGVYQGGLDTIRMQVEAMR